jgi:hypothetical protein
MNVRPAINKLARREQLLSDFFRVIRAGFGPARIFSLRQAFSDFRRLEQAPRRSGNCESEPVELAGTALHLFQPTIVPVE